MSQENTEIVRRVIDVMDAKGFEAALPVFLDAAHSDVESRFREGKIVHVKSYGDPSEALEAVGLSE
jgi:hypothetical protein